MEQGLTKEECSKIRAMLDESANPLFFYHDDPDGLASFLQMYKYKGEGRGSIIKSTPDLSEKYIRVVESLCPDLIVVLDVAHISEEFISHVSVPIIMIDHHDPIEVKGINYFNPRVHDPSANVPTSFLCYSILKDHIKSDILWIAMVGCVGDWFLPSLAKDFSEQYPELLPSDITTPQDALFATPLGELILLCSFMLKGPTKEVHKMIRALATIKSPEDILQKKTKTGKMLKKYAHRYYNTYTSLLESARTSATEDLFLVYTYTDATMSFTKELANALLYENPDKVILVGRTRHEEMKMSIRSGENIIVSHALECALKGIEGHGGGHEHACGACVKLHHFDVFFEEFKKQIFKNVQSP